MIVGKHPKGKSSVVRCNRPLHHSGRGTGFSADGEETRVYRSDPRRAIAMGRAIATERMITMGHVVLRRRSPAADGIAAKRRRLPSVGGQRMRSGDSARISARSGLYRESRLLGSAFIGRGAQESSHMQVRCPHCQTAVDFDESTSLTNLSCHLVGHSWTCWARRKLSMMTAPRSR